MKRIYLDNNATTKIDDDVLSTYINALKNYSGNPSSISQEGQKAKQALIDARSSIAKMFSVRPEEIIFFSSATEATNVILRGLFGYTLSGHVITTNIEHAAVYETICQLQSLGLEVSFVEPSPEAVEKAIQPNTKAIVMMAVNNETGIVTDIEKVAHIAKAHSVELIVDAVAQFGKMTCKIYDGISAMIFSGHKFHAPKGASFSFIRRGLKLFSFSTGGHQEYQRRSGTENVAFAVALEKAVLIAQDTLSASVTKMKECRDYFEKQLLEKLPFIQINGHDSERVSNCSNITFKGIDAEALLMYLDLHGVACSLGSACAAGGLEPSRVLLNMGLSVNDALSSIRFSLSRFTTKEEIERAVAIICDGVGVQRMSQD